MEEISSPRRADTKETVAGALRKMAKEGEVEAVAVEGGEGIYFRLTSGNLNSNRTSPAALHILSPFDNLVIQRRRLQKFFGFDYQIECYVPEPKRKWGYFCLPILRAGEFLGRIDAKADREKRVLLVRKVWLEPGVEEAAALAGLAAELEAFARFNGCERVKLPARIRRAKS